MRKPDRAPFTVDFKQMIEEKGNGLIALTRLLTKSF